jgi:prepilin-type N-terminal cleavage/methylation domain-containing protein
MHTKSKNHHPHRQAGFTLIELLGVIAIIAVILAIGVGVAMKIAERADVKETKTRLVMVMEAIDAYRENGPTGEYPEAINWEGDACGRPTSRGHGWCEKCADSKFQACSLYDERRMARLLEELETVEECKKLLSHLPDNAINRTHLNIGTQGNVKALLLVTILDSYEQPIRILPDGGLGGVPIVMSTGADVKVNTDDDIFSDR